MRDAEPSNLLPPAFSCNSDPEEARLEAQEYGRYMLAKSLFDCREYDRCADVFLCSNFRRAPLSEKSLNAGPRTPTSTVKGKGKGKEADRPGSRVLPTSSNSLPNLSQKSLFLALYAKYMSGEKRKDEDSEMILGPADGGSTVNKELVGLTRSLEGWFNERAAKGMDAANQGWLEYLYGIVLAKGKTEDEAKKWLLKSVQLCPYNWGAWLELSDLLNNVDDVRMSVQCYAG